MKTDRLIGILSVLLQKDKVTAPQLAEQFEVSRRTIQRDIDALCLAGIPIVTDQGFQRGIRIKEGYRMDRTVLTSKDMRMILAGLRSLDSVSGGRSAELLMEKLQAGSSELMAGRDSILIDLSSWYGKTLAPKIERIDRAIETGHLLAFHYVSKNSESERLIEPYYLLFHWSNWYVWGWCTEREDYRLFKLNRMETVKVSEQTFVSRNAPLPDLSNENVFPGTIKVEALFEPEVKWRLLEEFGRGSFTEREDGKLLFSGEYTDMENLISWILSFGDQAEVLAPEEARKKMKEISVRMMKRYKEGKG